MTDSSSSSLWGSDLPVIGSCCSFVASLIQASHSLPSSALSLTRWQRSQTLHSNDEDGESSSKLLAAQILARTCQQSAHGVPVLEGTAHAGQHRVKRRGEVVVVVVSVAWASAGSARTCRQAAQMTASNRDGARHPGQEKGKPVVVVVVVRVVCASSAGSARTCKQAAQMTASNRDGARHPGQEKGKPVV